MTATIPFAFNKDQIPVGADSVASGLACECTCPCCGERVLAKIGKGIRIPHFAHQSKPECAGARESAIHAMFKHVVAKTCTVGIHDHYIIESRQSEKYPHLSVSGSRHWIYGGVFCGDSGATEVAWNGFRLDAMIKRGDEKLGVEICYRHQVDENKAKALQQADFAVIEIFINNPDQFRTEDDIVKFLCDKKDRIMIASPEMRRAKVAAIEKLQSPAMTRKLLELEGDEDDRILARQKEQEAQRAVLTKSAIAVAAAEFERVSRQDKGNEDQKLEQQRIKAALYARRDAAFRLPGDYYSEATEHEIDLAGAWIVEFCSGFNARSGISFLKEWQYRILNAYTFNAGGDITERLFGLQSICSYIQKIFNDFNFFNYLPIPDADIEKFLIYLTDMGFGKYDEIEKTYLCDAGIRIFARHKEYRDFRAMIARTEGADHVIPSAIKILDPVMQLAAVKLFCHTNTYGGDITGEAVDAWLLENPVESLNTKLFKDEIWRVYNSVQTSAPELANDGYFYPGWMLAMMGDNRAEQPRKVAA